MTQEVVNVSPVGWVRFKQGSRYVAKLGKRDRRQVFQPLCGPTLRYQIFDLYLAVLNATINQLRSTVRHKPQGSVFRAVFFQQGKGFVPQAIADGWNGGIVAGLYPSPG